VRRRIHGGIKAREIPMSRRLMRILGMISSAVDDDPADSMRLRDDATTASVSRRRLL
jgi:hypothetical protein